MYRAKLQRSDGFRRTAIGRLEDAARATRGHLTSLAYRTRPIVNGPKGAVALTLRQEKWVYRRYLYTLLKFLNIEGHSVNLSAPSREIYRISRAKYEEWIFSERLVSLGRPRSGSRMIGPGGDIALEPVDFIKRDDPGEYVVPITQHPQLYALGLWDRPLDVSDPLCAIFFSGNSRDELYARAEIEETFGVISRARLLTSIGNARQVRHLHADALQDAAAGDIVFSDSWVRPEDFRPSMSRFAFFLCAPGVSMPFCHNIIEAMSAGAIPVVQQSYATLFEQPLVHGDTAIVFLDEHDLNDRIDAALAMPQAARQEMRARVLEYYDSYLTPRAVVSRMLAPQVRTIRLLAEEDSVELFRSRMRTATDVPRAEHSGPGPAGAGGPG